MRIYEIITEKVKIEDQHPNERPRGPETKPTMPAGTVKVDVSDVYDWYKLGQHISNLKGLGKHDFGKGPPGAIISFGSEEEEHKYVNALKKTGLTTTDIDPVDLKQPKGMKRQKTDPTYNVGENFADGKNPGRKGLAKRSGVDTKASVSSLRKTAKNSTGEKARMAHWMANMKAGRAKSEDIEEGWKDWVAGATLGAAALGANASNMVQQIVEPGDTVYSIARQNGVSPQDIMKLNNFNRDTKLVKGQTVTVPDNAKDIKSPTAKPAVKPAVKPASVGKPEAKAPVANNKIQVKSITNNPVEDAMRKIAVRAGIVGTELAAFMAQVAHESHDFQTMVEYGGSLDFRKYDPKYAPRKAKTLGNTKAGDGAKYKGRGFIQITGRYNYQLAGDALGLDLVKYPELAEKPGVAAKIAVWYWKLRVQPNVDNFNDVNAVTKPINPGMRGLADRKENFKNYMQVAMK